MNEMAFGKVLDKWYSIRGIKVSLWRIIPEGRSKMFLRKWQLGCKPYIPVEYLLNEKDIVVMVGSPDPEKIEKMAKTVGPEGRVILIEPDQTNLQKHFRNVIEKELVNVTIIPKAASNKKGKAKFLIAPRAEDHRLVIPEIEHDNDYREEKYYVREVDVDVDTVDNIIDELGLDHIDYIEIMVNGAEMGVLQGMNRMLGVTRCLFVKGHARYKETRKALRNDISELLRDRGFYITYTPPMPSVSKLIDWGEREGDVFAWKYS